MNSAPTVGVVIVTYNSADIIAACLSSVADGSSQPIHTVVVDNASTDGTPDLIARAYPSVALIRNSENRYYAAASNQGIRAARGEFILLLNPDTILPFGGIDALVRTLNCLPSSVALAPMLVLPNGERQFSLRELPGLDTLWYDLLGLSFLFPRSRRFGRWRMGYFDGRLSSVVEQPMASCLLVRRSVFEQIGAFDESYPMFFNDVDWCRRVREAGLTIWYTPDIKVAHVGGATVKKYRVRMIWMSHSAYFRYLRRLYRRDPARLVLSWLSWPPLMLAAVVRTGWALVSRLGSPRN